MKKDFSWKNSAQKYVEVYKAAIEKKQNECVNENGTIE